MSYSYNPYCVFFGLFFFICLFSYEDHFVDLCVDGRMILRWILWKYLCCVMDWIELTEDSDRWRALVNVVMITWVPENTGYF
jgi:hypothetical protein